jgi:hypothetical protein
VKPPAAGRAQKSFRNEATYGWRLAEPYGCTQVQELVVADQKQSRVSFGLSISVMNAAAMRPIAATLKERGPISVVLPLARNFELTISFPRVGVTVAVGALCVAKINATGKIGVPAR